LRIIIGGQAAPPTTRFSRAASCRSVQVLQQAEQTVGTAAVG
jgi:hypothetical protein